MTAVRGRLRARRRFPEICRITHSQTERALHIHTNITPDFSACPSFEVLRQENPLVLCCANKTLGVLITFFCEQKKISVNGPPHPPPLGLAVLFLHEDGQINNQPHHHGDHRLNAWSCRDHIPLNLRAGGPGSFLERGPLAARETGPATGRAAFRAARRSAEQLLELYTIRSDGSLDGRLEDRYERTDRMDRNMLLLQLYDVSDPSTSLIPVRSFLSL